MRQPGRYQYIITPLLSIIIHGESTMGNGRANNGGNNDSMVSLRLPEKPLGRAGKCVL